MPEKSKRLTSLQDFYRKIRGHRAEEEVGAPLNVDTNGNYEYPVQTSLEEEAELEEKRKRRLGLL